MKHSNDLPSRPGVSGQSGDGTVGGNTPLGYPGDGLGYSFFLGRFLGATTYHRASIGEISPLRLTAGSRTVRQSKSGLHILLSRYRVETSQVTTVLRVRSFLLLVLLSLASMSLFAEPLIINSSYSPPYSTAEGDGILEQILTEAFRRIGKDVEFRRLPAERALRDADQGVADGVVARVAGVEGMYSNLVMVPSATIPRRDFVAFTLDPEIEIGRWRDLAPYNVAYVRGWKIIEANVPGGTNVIRAASTELAFRLLQRKRTEVVINARLDGLVMASELGIEGILIEEPPLVSLSLYPYVHKKQEHLAERLAEALDEMKADGSFQAIYDEVMRTFDEQ